MPALVNVQGRDRNISQQELLRLLEGLWYHRQMSLLESSPDQHPEEALIGFRALPRSFVLCWQVGEQSSARHPYSISAYRACLIQRSIPALGDVSAMHWLVLGSECYCAGVSSPPVPLWDLAETTLPPRNVMKSVNAV